MRQVRLTIINHENCPLVLGTIKKLIQHFLKNAIGFVNLGKKGHAGF
jgi:hypothetical protein